MTVAMLMVTAALMAMLVHGEPDLPPGGVGTGAQECSVAAGLPLHVKLNNGVSVPRIGFGTAGLGNQAEEAVTIALAAGYRHIDTAQAQEWYREEAVGRAVRRATSAEATAPSGEGAEPTNAVNTKYGGAAKEGSTSGGGGALSREHVFVTTKIHPRDFGAERMGAMVEASNRNLQGVDLLLLHSPFCWPGSCPENPTPWQDGWRELEKLYSQGAVHAIGVSNFSETLLRELLLMATVVPAAVQNWMDPFHQDRAVRALCAENGIAYIAYSTLGGQWAYRPSTSSSKNPVSADPTLAAVAATHGRSVQAVALSWALQSGALVLPRSSDSRRIKENLRSFAPEVDETSSAVGDGDPRRSVDSGGAGPGCRAGETGSGAVVEVFLTDDDMRAIDLLDGTIGK